MNDSSMYVQLIVNAMIVHANEIGQTMQVHNHLKCVHACRYSEPSFGFNAEVLSRPPQPTSKGVDLSEQPEPEFSASGELTSKTIESCLPLNSDVTQRTLAWH